MFEESWKNVIIMSLCIYGLIYHLAAGCEKMDFCISTMQTQKYHEHNNGVIKKQNDEGGGVASQEDSRSGIWLSGSVLA